MTPAAAGSDAAPPTAQAVHAALIEKAQAVTAKVGRLSRDFAGAHKLAQQAQVREALTRTELSTALNESLSARAELEARLRDHALAAFMARGEQPLRRRGKAGQLLDRVLVRLGWPGQALVIARSGTWQMTGRLWRDLGNIAAYAHRGPDPDTTPSMPLDQPWYLAGNPDLAGARISPLAHYLVRGGQEGRDPMPLFDARWYGGLHAAALADSGVTPFEHYLKVGAARGFAPHPVFDTAHYLAQARTLGPHDIPPAHYLREGWREGLSPHPLFDPAWYLEQAPEAADQPPLVHYLTVGWKAGLTPHRLFDPRWYLEQNPTVAEAGFEPLTHFLAHGAAEGATPSPWFDMGAYSEARGPNLPTDVHPLIDYLRGGAWAVAEARPDLSTAAYIASRPGLVRRGVTPLEYWARRGVR